LPCDNAQVEGFQELVAPADLLHFSAAELQTVFAGSRRIEVDDVFRGAQLQGGYAEDSPQLQVHLIYAPIWPLPGPYLAPI